MAWTDSNVEAQRPEGRSGHSDTGRRAPRRPAAGGWKGASLTLLAVAAGSLGGAVQAQHADYGPGPQGTGGHRPIALHQLVVVPAGGDAVVALRGYDLDGDKLKATVKSLPGPGVVYQLSKVRETAKEGLRADMSVRARALLGMMCARGCVKSFAGGLCLSIMLCEHTCFEACGTQRF